MRTRYLILMALLLTVLLLAPRPTAAQTATATASATSTATATATATTPPVSWYATTEAGQDYRVTYSVNIGDVAFFTVQLIAIGVMVILILSGQRR